MTNKIVTFLMYSFLFVCLLASTDWEGWPLLTQGEIFRFDRLLLFGQIKIFHVFAFLFFLILFFSKLGPNNDRNILGNKNYVKNIFILYFIAVNILLYLAIYIKGITLNDLGVAPIVMFFVYLMTTFYVQDVFLENKDYKQLINIFTVLEILIVIRCAYSIIKYLLGFGYHDRFVGGRLRLGYENDFSDFFILLFIIALARFLFVNNDSKKLRRLHILGIISSSIIIIFSFRRYLWIEYILSILIILFFYYQSNKVNLNKPIMATCFSIVIITGSVLFVGVDKIAHNNYVGRLLTTFSIINNKEFSSKFGDDTGHRDELKDGWYNVKKNWLLGVTPFGGDKVVRFKTKQWQTYTYVHNAYLWVWLNYGLLGLILFVILYWKSIKLGLELYIKQGNIYGLILFTFCIVQSTKNIVWGTIIHRMNATIIYIVIISIALKMKRLDIKNGSLDNNSNL